jgi:hypothetical protein
LSRCKQKGARLFEDDYFYETPSGLCPDHDSDVASRIESTKKKYSKFPEYSGEVEFKRKEQLKKLGYL